MKKVLIITYYWPPSGGAGVQRWLKFVKYLRSFGWEPIVYTPSNGEIPIEDPSLQKDVPENLTILKQPIWEPYSIYKKFIGQKKNEKINAAFLTEGKKPKFTEKISVWVRGNFFIPDARKFWVKPSVSFLSNYLKANPVDVIISSGPPHSMHLIAMQLKQKLNIPWLADFRDPWTNIDFYKDLMLTAWADKKHHQLEKAVLKNADKVLSIGKTMTAELEKICDDKKPNKFITITNGYDESDVSNIEVDLDKKFSIAHIGTMVKSRNPEVLWDALNELLKEIPDFENNLELKLVGKVDFSVMQTIEQKALKKYVNKIDYLNHADVIKMQQNSQLLLLIVNNTKNAKGILTGKFFEYLSAKRPILCIGPHDGEVAEILRETSAGSIANYDEKENLKSIIKNYYALFKNNNLNIQSKNISTYSRKALTGNLAEVLNTMTKA